ncbi:flagellar assembly lytic transglycosylase [Treponema brennaborense]|uniref:Lytic transglycosylase catalytic n=1 Tax=Treponema brennaborense (strain DSM 12168 / CIP 105900 / DD5/3) TaxID=906968 RepID=F4LMC5_TREBD|nr:lytic transglycosylase domain-containing protein [Treponema brennaborense]AEE17791.1 Lytic transglycosylase catalytic [Treponema brennaborense DSM 12168]
MRRSFAPIVWFLTIAVCLAAGCTDASGADSPHISGKNAYYFLGEKNLRAGDVVSARRFFAKGAKKSDPPLARMCAEALTKTGTLKERLDAAGKYAAVYSDLPAKLRAAQEFDAAKEYAAVLKLTENLEAGAPDELIRLRLTALEAKRYAAFAAETENWFFSRPVSQEHRTFFDTIGVQALTDALGDADVQLIKLRLSVYRRDYAGAFQIVTELRGAQEDGESRLASLPEQLLSDVGKTFLYGSTDYAANAAFFDKAATAAEKAAAEKTTAARSRPDAASTDNPVHALFFTRFYAGRLYDRASAGNVRTAAERYLQAMQAAPDADYYDNALWYYFSVQLKISPDAAERALAEFIGTVNDPSYYADFFDALCVTLFSGRKWQQLYRVYRLIEPYADAETVSKYAYVCARLIEEKRLIPEDAAAAKPQNPETLARTLFERAYRPGGAPYYRMLAGYRLGTGAQENRETLYRTELEALSAPDEKRELLLSGYAAYGLPELIYTEWQKDPLSVRITATAQAADFLSSCADPEYRSQGLRMMSNALYHADTQPTEAMYETAYPRLYRDEITDAAAQYGLSEYVLYALIRSESFFDPLIMSHAGAIGLAQLMAPTATDIARKLKLSEYDLEDARTNIRFGAFYLEELIRRLDGSVLDALFAYNGGITRVRNWKKDSGGLPPDLFLETIPFAETREYGRKVTSAAVWYGILYYDKSAADVIREIMSF